LLLERTEAKGVGFLSLDVAMEESIDRTEEEGVGLRWEEVVEDGGFGLAKEELKLVPGPVS